MPKIKKVTTPKVAPKATKSGAKHADYVDPYTANLISKGFVKVDGEWVKKK